MIISLELGVLAWFIGTITFLVLTYKTLTRDGHAWGIVPTLWRLSFYAPVPPSLRQRLIRILSPTFVVGAVAIIRSADRGYYLLARHTYPIGTRRDEIWGLPGGGVRQDEPIAAALTREICQELGVNASVGRLLLVAMPDPARIDFFFECVMHEETFTSSSEIIEAAYFPRYALPDGMSAGHRFALEIIDEHLRHGLALPALMHRKVEVRRANDRGPITSF